MFGTIMQHTESERFPQDNNQDNNQEQKPSQQIKVCVYKREGEERRFCNKCRKFREPVGITYNSSKEEMLLNPSYWCENCLRVGYLTNQIINSSEVISREKLIAAISSNQSQQENNQSRENGIPQNEQFINRRAYIKQTPEEFLQKKADRELDKQVFEYYNSFTSSKNIACTCEHFWMDEREVKLRLKRARTRVNREKDYLAEQIVVYLTEVEVASTRQIARAVGSFETVLQSVKNKLSELKRNGVVVSTTWRNGEKGNSAYWVLSTHPQANNLESIAPTPERIIFMQIVKNPGIHALELTGFSPSTISRLLKTLTNQGYLNYTASSHTNACRYYYPSPLGLRFFLPSPPTPYISNTPTNANKPQPDN